MLNLISDGTQQRVDATPLDFYIDGMKRRLAYTVDRNMVAVFDRHGGVLLVTGPMVASHALNRFMPRRGSRDRAARQAMHELVSHMGSDRLARHLDELANRPAVNAIDNLV